MKRLLWTASVAAAFAIASGAWAAPAVVIAPADTTVSLGDTFTLRIECPDPIADLKGYQLIRGYDLTKLQFLGATAGDVMTGTGRANQLFVYPTATPDSVWLDCAMLDGSTSTPGVLAYMTFKAIAKGDTPITCLGDDFRDSQNQTTIPDCSPGMVHIEGPTPVAPVTWGRVKQLYH